MHFENFKRPPFHLPLHAAATILLREKLVFLFYISKLELSDLKSLLKDREETKLDKKQNKSNQPKNKQNLRTKMNQEWDNNGL